MYTQLLFCHLKVKQENKRVYSFPLSFNQFFNLLEFRFLSDFNKNDFPEKLFVFFLLSKYHRTKLQKKMSFVITLSSISTEHELTALTSSITYIQCSLTVCPL